MWAFFFLIVLFRCQLAGQATPITWLKWSQMVMNMSEVGLQRYILPRYDTYPDKVVMIRYDTLHNNKTRRVLSRVLLVGSEVCTADKPSWKHTCCVCHLEYNAKHCSAWIFLLSLLRKSPCIIRTKKQESEH